MKLPGYNTHQSHRSAAGSYTAFLTQRHLTVTHAKFDGVDIEHDFIKILPQSHRIPTISILNVYSKPKDKKHKFDTLFVSARKEAGRHPLVIVGDFNAPHQAWGYRTSTPKGRGLWELIQDSHLTVHNNIDTPTRLGNSVAMDTTPDLTLSLRARNVDWLRLDENLGSDHYIVQTSLSFQHKPFRSTQLSITDWAKFREYRGGQMSGDILDIEQWVDQLKDDALRYTTTLPEEAQMQEIDAKLLHMWTAKSSLLRRWRGQRYNRKLRRRIAKLDLEIQDYAEQLAQQQWGQKCESLSGRLSNKRTWQLLRHLLDPTESKTVHGHQINKILHERKDDLASFFQELRDKHLPSQTKAPHVNYTGSRNPELDAPITEAEVAHAMANLKTTSASGPDQVSNKMLRNLDRQAVAALTKYFNECLETGTLPKQWRDARVIFIPKPGKPINPDNLRPISLTSCLGKLLEHVILYRLTAYVEEAGIFPTEMIGFRKHLSTQDIMLQLQKDIIRQSPGLDTKAVLALDLRGAFNNVSHATILRELNGLDIGERTYKYISNFLKDRTATIHMGTEHSSEFKLGSFGTPQGSVLSPFLFNVAMLNIARELQAIPNISFALYADDITIWTRGGGSDAELQELLQKATDRVNECAQQLNLTCAPTKSELLLLPSHKRAEKHMTPIHITLDGTPIPIVDNIRILGLTIQKNRQNTTIIQRLRQSVDQTIRLIGRVSNKRGGLRERELLQLVQAFVIPHITYTVPYLTLTKREEEEINTLIRKVHKFALGLPMRTSTERFLATGAHNTVSELIEAHLNAQYYRLAKSTTGRCILHSLDINPPF